MKAAFGRVVEVKKLRSQGVTRVMVEIPAEYHAKLTEWFDEEDVLLTLATFEVKRNCNYGVLGVNPETLAEAAPKTGYGHLARSLRTSGFFRGPPVQRAIGTDEQYQAWCRQQPGAITGRKDEIVYAHVRRANNSGTSVKPDYSGIPLTKAVHDLQHQKGELAALQLTHPNVLDANIAKGWYETQVQTFLERWGWETLKAELGFESWADVPPEKLRAWATQHDVAHVLPKEYRE